MILSSLLDYYSLLLIMWGFRSMGSFSYLSNWNKTTEKPYNVVCMHANVMISRHYVVIALGTETCKKADCMCIFDGDLKVL